ncbi:MAG: hypothetical protein WD995_01150 [Gemmatimonadota bacterium]
MRRPPLTVAVLAMLASSLGTTADATSQGRDGAGQTQDPAALVVRVQGVVQVERGAASAPAAAGLRLLAGDRVVPTGGGRAILVTRSGAQQVVSEPVTLSAPEAGAPTNMFARAVSTLAQAATLDATLGGRQGMIRPIPGRSSLVAPRNGLGVSSARPTFRWTATPGERYELMIRRIEGGRPVIFHAGTDTVWTLPDDVTGLEPGATYAWTVFVGGREGGRPLSQQEFRVIDDTERAAVEARLGAIRSMGLDPSDDGLTLAALTYRQLELYYEASDALSRLRSSGVPLGPDLHRLEGEVWAALGDEDAARAAFDRAAGAAR